jgi:tubulin-specific chaperone A
VEKANSTPLAQQEKLQKQLHDLKVQLGEELYPTWQAGMGLTSQMVSLLSTLISFVGQYGKQILAVTALLSSYKIAVVASTVETKAWGVVTGVAKAAQAAWNAVIGAGRVAIIAYTYGMRGATMATKAFTTATKANPWGLLLTVVTTAVGAIWSFVAGTEEAAEKTEDLSEAADAVADAMSNAGKSVAEEKTKIEELVRVIESESAAYDDKKRAMLELEKIVPGFQADIGENIRLTDANTTAIKNYINALDKKALAEAFYGKLAENNKKRADLLTVKESALANINQKK